MERHGHLRYWPRLRSLRVGRYNARRRNARMASSSVSTVNPIAHHTMSSEGTGTERQRARAGQNLRLHVMRLACRTERTPTSAQGSSSQEGTVGPPGPELSYLVHTELFQPRELLRSRTKAVVAYAGDFVLRIVSPLSCCALRSVKNFSTASAMDGSAFLAKPMGSSLANCPRDRPWSSAYRATRANRSQVD